MRLPMTIAVLSAISSTAMAQAPWDSVGHILQSPPVPQQGYTRYNFPRTDISVRVNEITLHPSVASTSWVGFAGDVNDAVTMGDIVTTLVETGSVTAALTEEGIDFQAIHNHLAGSLPNVTYIHFHGHGNLYALARSMDRVLAQTRTARPVRPAAPELLAIDTALIFRTLGRSGTARGEVAQVGFQFVNGPVTMDGQVLVPGMAYGSPMVFQAISPTRAVATGDFAIPEQKVTAVRRALVANGITPTAMHSHLVGETPRLYYIHFWAEGSLESVATGLRRVVDAAR